MKKNNYSNFRNILKYLKSEESFILRKESDLIDELNDVLEIDRSNNIIRKLFHRDERINNLLNSINTEINNINLLIRSKVSSKTEKYLIRKEKLTTLKNEILYYINSQDIDVDDMKYDLIEKCLLSLNFNKSQPKFFGKVMVEDDYTLNKDTISRVYNILEDSELMGELVLGVSKINEEEKYSKIINSCSEAKKYKKKIYDNQDLIIEYNDISERMYELGLFLTNETRKDYDKKHEAISKELNELLSNKINAYLNKRKMMGLINKKDVLERAIDNYESSQKEYSKLNKKLRKLEEKLKAVGLFEIISKKDDSDSNNIYLLSNMIHYFVDKNSIDGYYKFIEGEEKLNKETLIKIRRDNRNYLSGVSEKARNLLINCTDTCKRIYEFADYSKNDSSMDSSISLFVLNGLVTIEDSSYEDKEFRDDEINSIALYYESTMNDYYNSFLAEYNDIMSSNKVKNKR